MQGSSYISIGYNFLQLAINSVGQMTIQGNENSMFSNGREFENDGWAEFDEKTSWTDENVGIPILFNFFHGVELILKGLIDISGGELKKNSHRLNGLLDKLKTCPNPPADSVIDLITQILTVNGFEDFFKSNNTNVDSFYEVFKYPEFGNGSQIDFRKIRGLGEVGIEKYQAVKELAIGLKNEIIIWKRQDS